MMNVGASGRSDRRKRSLPNGAAYRVRWTETADAVLPETAPVSEHESYPNWHDQEEER